MTELRTQSELSLLRRAAASGSVRVITAQEKATLDKLVAARTHCQKQSDCRWVARASRSRERSVAGLGVGFGRRSFPIEAFALQASAATRANTPPRDRAVRRSPSWCRYPPLRQSGGSAQAVPKKGHHKRPWQMIAGRAPLSLNSLTEAPVLPRRSPAHPGRLPLVKHGCQTGKLQQEIGL